MNARDDELMLDSMGPMPSGFEIKTHAGGPETANALLFMADSMRAALDGHNAPNYLEMEVQASDGKRYIMTLQRAGKITPHQARIKAEEALEASKPRQVSTVEELDALPGSSVVKDVLTQVFEKQEVGVWHDGPHDWLAFDGKFWDVDAIHLPASVLYEPRP